MPSWRAASRSPVRARPDPAPASTASRTARARAAPCEARCRAAWLPCPPAAAGPWRGSEAPTRQATPSGSIQSHPAPGSRASERWGRDRASSAHLLRLEIDVVLALVEPLAITAVHQARVLERGVLAMVRADVVAAAAVEVDRVELLAGAGVNAGATEKSVHPLQRARAHPSLRFSSHSRSWRLSEESVWSVSWLSEGPLSAMSTHLRCARP